MATKTQKHYYTLQEVIKDKDMHILNVLNNSKPRGNITFEVGDGMGGKLSILIPTTWVAIDLTTQGPREFILNNPQFRKLLASGMLQLPTDDYIDVLKTKEGYDKESKKTYSHIRASEEGFQTEANPEAKQLQEGENVSGLVLNLVMDDSLDAGEVLNSVRLQKDSMSVDDLQYLVANCKHPKVKALVAEELTERNVTQN